MQENETTEFWLKYPLDDLALRVAALHAQRRELQASALNKEIEGARKTVSDFFIRGAGIEVGAGARPFPIPQAARCFYGDLRSIDDLKCYFKTDAVVGEGTIDAQSFAGINNDSLDFVISAHVIEHLEDPIGSIRNAIRVLKPSGVHLLAVPDLRYTFDRHRKPTALEHLLVDAKDGGASTRMEAYIEFIRDVARPEWDNQTPDDQLESAAREMAERGDDIHFHAWTGETFTEMLRHIAESGDIHIVGSTFSVNENIFVLEKMSI